MEDEDQVGAQGSRSSLVICLTRDTGSSVEAHTNSSTSSS